MNAPAAPRIGIAGFFLEANRFAPVTTGEMFANSFDLAGEALLAELQRSPTRTLPDLAGFVAGMHAGGAWQPVALRAAAAYPGGPVAQAWFDAFVQDIEERLRDALPLQGVFVSSHGAALATAHDDPDGELFERIRRVVGPTVPVVAVLDLHTNVSPRMCAALSAFVAYRSNPHVDLFERGEEAATLLRRMLHEGPGEVALVKLPFLPASTDQLIGPGTPYGQLVDAGQAHVAGPILNVSLCGGFALSDCAKCGFSVVVSSAHGHRASAHDVALQLAGRVWARRRDFLTELTPMANAVALAVQCGASTDGPRLMLADVADNPGGGAGGNTVFLLRALLEAGARQVLMAVHTDAALAAEAHRHGVGAHFRARFNRDLGGQGFAEDWQADARVLALGDGEFHRTAGPGQGQRAEHGAVRTARTGRRAGGGHLTAPATARPGATGRGGRRPGRRAHAGGQEPRPLSRGLRWFRAAAAHHRGRCAGHDHAQPGQPAAAAHSTPDLSAGHAHGLA